MRRRDTDGLCLVCDECESAWRSPGEAHDGSKAFHIGGLALDLATRADIARRPEWAVYPFCDCWPVVARGSWLYDGTVRRSVLIIRGDVHYGSGDYEDPPEVAEDREVETFYVSYPDPDRPADPPWPNGGGFPSLAEAKAHVQHILRQNIEWDEMPELPTEGCR
jgi:hypothetical protein